MTHRKKIGIIISVIVVGSTVGIFARNYSPPADPNIDTVGFISRPISLFFDDYAPYLANIDTNGLTRINLNEADVIPTWSPQGDKVAYFHNDDLYVANANDARNSQVVLQNNGWSWVWWSLDGLKLVTLGHNPESVKVLNLESKVVPKSIQILNPADVAWSPNSSKVAVLGEKEIQIFELETNQVHPISLPESYIGDDLDWSPSNDKLAFAISTGIVVVNVDSGGSSQLTFGHNDRFPKWSPDGQQIAFVRMGRGGHPSSRPPLGKGDIYIIDVARGNGRWLTENERIVEPFVWSPDGSRIVFISEKDSKCRSLNILPMDSGARFCASKLKVMNADGTDVILVKRAKNERILDLVWISQN